MSIYSISDIHVKPDGQNQELLKQFLAIEFQKNDIVVFLGDIFDLVIGNHIEYYEKYDYFFRRLRELQNNSIEVYYIEGNHDFHLEKLLKQFSVKVYKRPVKITWKNLEILFCHGDEIEIGNIGYKIYKAFIRSRPLNIIGNYLLPYKILNYIGFRASAKSRKKNKNRYGNPQKNLKIRDSFRQAAIEACRKYKVSIVVAGHSHFLDIYKEKNIEYFNNGYNPYTKSYIRIENEIEIIKFAGH